MKPANSVQWPNPPKVFQLNGPFLLVHGGIGDATPKFLPRFNQSIEKVARASQKLLQSKWKDNATELALRSVELLENDPTFNAGFGSKLQRDGIARLSAAVMDGATQKMAAVSNIQRIRNPSKITRLLLDERDRTLSGLEANAYAFEKGIMAESVETPERLEEWKKKKEGKTGTVGCVALDSQQRTAACTSTGGKGFEIPGRVSDSCTPAGNFANRFGAVSCTGVGEDILEIAAASTICARLEDGFSLSEAVQKTFAAHRNRFFGVIALDQNGNACVHGTQGNLTFALVTPSEIYFGSTPEVWATATAANFLSQAI